MSKKIRKHVKTSISAEVIQRQIYLIRGHRVMLDRDLAALYGVQTRVLNQAVKRNLERFPPHFMLSLTREEIQRISQFVTSLKFSKNVQAFTEQGVAMLSSVLNSRRAIQVNIAIMRAFVRLREMVSTHRALTVKLAELENKIAKHDKGIQDIFDRIYELADPSKLEDTIGSTD